MSLAEKRQSPVTLLNFFGLEAYTSTPEVFLLSLLAFLGKKSMFQLIVPKTIDCIKQN